jgi:hypothetical protein
VKVKKTPLILKTPEKNLPTKINNFLDLIDMNTVLKSSQTVLLKEPDAPKLNSILKKRLVVQSRCGGLDYLSPLGVLMALMPYTNYQKTTPTTFHRNRKQSRRNTRSRLGLWMRGV